MALEFLRRGKIVRVEDFAPDTMLFDFLRLTEKSRGTKEGCNEGDLVPALWCWARPLMGG